MREAERDFVGVVQDPKHLANPFANSWTNTGPKYPNACDMYFVSLFQSIKANKSECAQTCQASVTASLQESSCLVASLSANWDGPRGNSEIPGPQRLGGRPISMHNEDIPPTSVSNAFYLFFM